MLAPLPGAKQLGLFHPGRRKRGHLAQIRATSAGRRMNSRAIPGAKKKKRGHFFLGRAGMPGLEKSPPAKKLAILSPIKSNIDEIRPETAPLPLNQVKFRFFGPYFRFLGDFFAKKKGRKKGPLGTNSGAVRDEFGGLRTNSGALRTNSGGAPGQRLRQEKPPWRALQSALGGCRVQQGRQGGRPPRLAGSGRAAVSRITA